MAAAPDDDAPTAPCDKCEMSIPADVDRCPVCGYRPAGYNPTLLRVGEACFALAAVVSVVIFLTGVTGIVPDPPVLPAGAFSKMAIIMPYTTGISGFFAYYIHGKRRTKPTDSSAFD
jgi:hypothetical protein